MPTRSDERQALALTDRLRRPTVGGSIGLFVGVCGAVIGSRSLADNSLLTHLATGRLILERGAVPSADPYTFSAPDTPWVVQSWAASWLYATAEAVGGLGAVRLVCALAAAVVAVICWRLSSPADGLVVRIGLAALFLTVGAGEWTERPLMIGLVCFGATILVSERDWDPRWLLPLGWVWVNTHGSFPLAPVYLVVVGIGSMLDGTKPARELRLLAWSLGGIVLGALGPLGLRALTFPFDLLSRQEILSNVIEWQAPDFATVSERAFLAQLVVAIVLIARRPSYRHAAVVAAFGAAAVYSSRNIAVASIALLPGMAQALAGIGALKCGERPRIARPLAVAILGLSALMGAMRLGIRDLDLDRYPVAAIAYLESGGADLAVARLAGPDYVGNLLGFLYGPERVVFYDDRFDMFPTDLSKAELALMQARSGALKGLRERSVTLIVVTRDHPVARELALDPTYRILFHDDGWVLACERGTSLDADGTAC